MTKHRCPECGSTAKKHSEEDCQTEIYDESHEDLPYADQD